MYDDQPAWAGWLFLLLFLALVAFGYVTAFD